MVLTKQCNYIQSVLLDPDTSIQKLEGLLASYQTRMQEVKEIFEEIIEIMEEEHIEEEINSQYQFTSEKEEISYSLLEQIDKLKAKSVTGASLTPREDDALSTVSKSGEISLQAKLPKIVIKPFDGDLECWESFYENYCEIIHNNHTITDTKRFTYLQSLLQGEALEVIQGFSLSSESYHAAWKQLQENYGKPERIALRHVASLINLAPPSSTKGPTLVASLTKMLNKIQGHLRSLNNLGPLKAETILCPWIVSKFPEAVTLEWGHQSQGRESDLQYTLDFLKRKIYQLDFTADVRLMEKSEPRQQALPIAVPKGTALSLHTQATNGVFPSAATPAGGTSKCAACLRPGHSIRECKIFKSQPHFTKMDILKETKLCWRCLKSQYPCSCRRTCQQCSGGHHEQICQKNTAQRPSSGASGPTRPGYAHPGAYGGPTPYNHHQPYVPYQQGPQHHGPQPQGPQHQGHQPYLSYQQGPQHYGSQPQGPQQQGPQPQGPQQQGPQPQGPQQGFQRVIGGPSTTARGGSLQQQQHPTHRQNYTSSNVALAATEPQPLVTMLQIANTQVRTNQGNLIPITVLLDSGADRTYVRNDLVTKAGLREVGKSNIAYSSFGGEKEPKAKLRSVLELDLVDINGEVFSIKAVGVDTICQPIKRAALSDEALQAFRHLNPLTTDYGESRVSTINLLIGLDQYWSMINERYTVRHHNLVAQATRFGYIISGSYGNPDSIGNESITDGAPPYDIQQAHTQLLVLDMGEQRAEQIWNLDTIGIQPTEAKNTCLDQDPVYQILIKELEYDSEIKKYKAPLLWKSDTHRLRLANNFKQAEARLNSLHRRTLDPNPQLCENYYNIMYQYIDEGKVQIIPQDEIHIQGRPTYYLPHRPILKPQASSSQVRPVFDASSKTYTGYSLNDLCHTGPSLLPDLVGVILRFRRWKWVISGDVRQAFLNIFIKDEDRDVHRFLIKRGEEIIHCKFNVIPFGNTCSPFLLQAILKYHFQTFPDNSASRELSQNCYMDNVLSGADSQDEAEELYSTFCYVFEKAGMTLDKWTTNVSQLQSKLLIDNRQPTSHKILGVEWDKASDSFVFNGVLSHNIKLPLTKRSLLSILGSFFDPLGLISPFVLMGKIIFQTIWKLNLSWDSPLPEDIAQ